MSCQAIGSAPVAAPDIGQSTEQLLDWSNSAVLRFVTSFVVQTEASSVMGNCPSPTAETPSRLHQ